MDPEELRLFMRQSAQRLVSFDPNFDAPIVEPLPSPWANNQAYRGVMVSDNYSSHYSRQYDYYYGRQAPAATGKFAQPRLPTKTQQRFD